MALRNNDNFRHDVAQYQEDLRKGWHDPEWIRQAQAAHRKREAGEYNEYLATRFKEEWGIPLPDQDKENGEVSNGECRRIITRTFWQFGMQLTQVSQQGNDLPKDEGGEQDESSNAMEGIETNG